MKKVFILAMILLLVFSSLFAAPYGFRQGMSREEALKVSVISSVITPNSDKADAIDVEINDTSSFAGRKARLFFDSRNELFSLMLITAETKTNSFGTSATAHYNRVKVALEKTYGKANVYEFVTRGSLWVEPQYFMMGLLKEERTMASLWQDLDGEVVEILLNTRGLSTDSYLLVMMYDYSNAKRARTEQVVVTDGIF